MLIIHITNGDPANGILEFEVNGNPNDGNNSAKKRWKVQWKVRPGDRNRVNYIESIEMKTGPGAPSSTDVFSGDGQPPTAHPDRYNWKATVSSDAPDHAKYHYDIRWVAKGSTNVLTHDPLIAIKPTHRLEKLILFLLGLFGLSLLFHRRKKTHMYKRNSK
jgi:hypothetical protein